MMTDYFEKQKNMELGRKISSARRKKKVTQQQLQLKIWDYYLTKYELLLKTNNFSAEEIESYLNIPFNDLDYSIKQKLKRIGIKEDFPSPIAISTISHYENGDWEIPAWFMEVAKEILDIT